MLIQSSKNSSICRKTGAGILNFSDQRRSRKNSREAFGKFLPIGFRSERRDAFRYLEQRRGFALSNVQYRFPKFRKHQH